MSDYKVGCLDAWTPRLRDDPEPPRPDSPLFGLDHVVLTPHTAASVFDDVETVARHAFGTMQAFPRGKPIVPADLVGASRRPDGGADRIAVP